MLTAPRKGNVKAEDISKAIYEMRVKRGEIDP